METGCALIAFLVVIALVWLVVHLVSSGSARRSAQDLRLQNLEIEVAQLRQAMAQMQDPAGTAEPGTAEPGTAAARNTALGTTASVTSDRLEPGVRTESASEDLAAGDSSSMAATGASEDAALTLPAIPEIGPSLPAETAVTARSISSSADSGLGKSATTSEDSQVEDDVPRASVSFDGPFDESTDGGGPGPEPGAEPPRSAPSIDWEQWVGVRGLAVLAGIVLAVAGIYFVRFSIERNLIPPAVRVALLLLAGVASVLFGERFRKRGHIFPANALQGAGIVMSYAAVWAARNLYDLVGSGVAFLLLALITAAGGALAIKHQSLVIALLGLLGGFATPLLVSSGSDNAIGLFGYLLLLNAGVALVGRKGHWPILSALSLVATVLYQAAWILQAAEGRVVLGLSILAVFSLFFLWSSGRGARVRSDEDEAEESLLGQLGMIVGALFSPFAFAVYLASQADTGDQLLPFGGLLLLLNAAAAWMARRQQLPELASGAVAATLGVLAVWPFSQDFSHRSMIECLIGLLVLVATHQLASHFLSTAESPAEARTGLVALRWRAPELAAAAASGLAIPILHAVDWWESGPSLWFTVGLAAVTAALLYQSSRFDETSSAQEPETRSVSLAWIPAGLASLALGLHLLLTLVIRSNGEGGGVFAAPGPLVAALLAGVGFQFYALSRSRSRSRSRNRNRNRSLQVDGGTGVGSRVEWALALYPMLALGSLAIAGRGGSVSTPLILVSTTALVMGLFMLLTATRLLSGKLVVLSLLGVSVVHLAIAESWVGSPRWALAFTAIAILLFVVWPSLFPRSLARFATRDADEAHDIAADGRWPLSATRAAALAPVLMAPSFHTFFVEAFGDTFPALSMLLLGAISLGGLRLAGPRMSSLTRTSTLAWFGAVSLGFVAIAVPIQLEREWITIGWALLALGVAALWRRVDHAGLKFFALGLGLAVTARLLLNPEIFNYHQPRAPWGIPVLGWLLYTYLLPALAMLGAAHILDQSEGSRLRQWEPFGLAKVAWVSRVLGFFGIAVLFAWINLTIFDAFAVGDQLRIALDRAPARDLTLSFSWGLFALALLVLGVARASKTLRWGSLLMIFATIAKVFLYDLGELEDLYRVASLVGLAFSLLGVSVLYQRFVFNSRDDEHPGELAVDESREHNHDHDG